MKGSTLIETMISMTLIVIIITGSFFVLAAIAGSTLNHVKVYAGLVINEALVKDKYDTKADTLRNYYGGFFIEKELLPNDNTDHLKTLVVKAVTPQGKMICYTRRIVAISEE